MGSLLAMHNLTCMLAMAMVCMNRDKEHCFYFIYTDELMAMECCVVVKKGLKMSKIGRGYHNLAITPLPRFIEPGASDDELAASLFGLVLLPNIQPSGDHLSQAY